jgi:chromosome segregation ATPase
MFGKPTPPDLEKRVERLEGRVGNTEECLEKVDFDNHRVKTGFNQVYAAIEEAKRLAKEALSMAGQWEYQFNRLKEKATEVQTSLFEVQEMRRELKRLSEAHVNCNQSGLDRDEKLRDVLNAIHEQIGRLR